MGPGPVARARAWG